MEINSLRDCNVYKCKMNELYVCVCVCVRVYKIFDYLNF